MTAVQLCELTADHGTAVRRYLMYSTALWTKARETVTARTPTVVKCSLAFSELDLLYFTSQYHGNTLHA